MPPEMLDMMMNRLDQIHAALHELRQDVNNKMGQLSVAVAGLAQWRETQTAVLNGHTEEIKLLKANQDQAAGARKAVYAAGALITLALSVLEVWLHKK